MSNSYYGSYRTRSFTEIFPSITEFKDLYDNSEIPKLVTDETVVTTYYLLYARYGNSHISHSDENQFKYGILSKIFMYGPSWEKRLEIQNNLRGLTEAEILQGSKAIYNHAFNPGTSPSTGSIEELDYVNDQNTTNYKKSKMSAYADLLALLETDVTERYVAQFKSLFIKVVAPDYPLLYESEVSDFEVT